MPKAIWNGVVLAESEAHETVEGNVYFPPNAVVAEHLRPSARTTVCPWKGTANYFDLVADGKEARDAAWIYRHPKEAAANITDYVAFYSPPVTIET